MYLIVTLCHKKNAASSDCRDVEAGRHEVPKYSKKQKAALEAMMQDDVHRHATEIITSEGLQGLTMDRLAKAVGVSRATLYNYFADRDAVVEFVEKRTFLPLLEAADRIADGDQPPSEKLRAIAHEVFASVYANSAFVVALSPEQHSDAYHESKRARRNRGQDALKRVVREGIDRGVFRDLPAGPTAGIFLGAITGMIDTMVFDGEFREPDEVVPTLMEVFLRGLSK
jgi:AcrR family transcriptional regulator